MCVMNYDYDCVHNFLLFSGETEGTAFLMANNHVERIKSTHYNHTCHTHTRTQTYIRIKCIYSFTHCMSGFNHVKRLECEQKFPVEMLWRVYGSNCLLRRIKKNIERACQIFILKLHNTHAQTNTHINTYCMQQQHFPKDYMVVLF